MLKKIFLVAVFGFVFSSSVFAEIIESYEANLEIQKDASVLVEEKINYDFGNNYKHGIYRFIPLYFKVEGQGDKMKKREIKISQLEVYRDGGQEPVAELINGDSNGNYFIKIGRASYTMNGLHKYIIKYRVDGSLRYFDDFDEIYWNATGNDWSVAIKAARVNLSSENNFLNFKDKACYLGRTGSKETCRIVENGSEVIFESVTENRPTGFLKVGEGLTVAVSFDKGLVSVVEYYAWDFSGIWEKFWAAILSFFGAILGFFGWLIYKWKNKYNPNDPIIPIYKPYKNFHPALTGYLIDQKFDSRDITAGILSLAQKGYIEIEKVKNKVLFFNNTDYIFRRKVELENVNDELDRMFLSLLFEESSLENIFNTVNRIADGSLEKEVKLSDFSLRSDELRSNRNLIDKWLEKYAINNKLIEKKQVGWAIAIFVILIFGTIFFGDKMGVFVFIPSFLIFISFWIGVILSQRKTQQGWKVENNLKGFKKFLEMTEKERIEFFNSPENNPQEFLEYLPYAIAFEVEKKWERQFQNITVPKPDWYVGPGPFMAATFTSDISDMSSSISSAVTTSSGSSGGGSSGGGIGGGGGGSW